MADNLGKILRTAKVYTKDEADGLLDGKATKADATLTTIPDGNWIADPPTVEYQGTQVTTPIPHWYQGGGVVPEYFWEGAGWYVADSPGDYTYFGNDSRADSFSYAVLGSIPVGATRTLGSGYRLGPDDASNPNRDKPLATAEQGAKADAALPASNVVAPSTSSSDSGKAADAKATGDALADKIDENNGSANDLEVDGLRITGQGTQGRCLVFDLGGYEVGTDGDGVYDENSGEDRICWVFGQGDTAFATRADIAPRYDGETSHSYAAGQLVSHGGSGTNTKIYRCVTAHTATSWVAANWALATVEDILAALRAGKADKVANPTNGCFVAMDASGNLKNSEKKASDFVLKNAAPVTIGDGVAAGTAGSIVAIGQAAKANAQNATSIGHNAEANGLRTVAIGSSDAMAERTAAFANYSVAIGGNAVADATSAVQIGSGTNSVEKSLKFRSTMLVDGNGKIPTASLDANVVKTPVYDGQNHAWLPSTGITEGDDWTVSGNVYEWAAPRKCIAYFRMTGTSNGAFVRLGVNMHPDADPDNAYTVFNIPSLTSTALVPVFLNAGDTVYFKVANNNLGSMSLSVFYTD